MVHFLVFPKDKVQDHKIDPELFSSEIPLYQTPRTFVDKGSSSTIKKLREIIINNILKLLLVVGVLFDVVSWITALLGAGPTRVTNTLLADAVHSASPLLPDQVAKDSRWSASISEYSEGNTTEGFMKESGVTQYTEFYLPFE
ncbi:hypothetical protein Tco_1054601 [Tanacetum coccineum]|uniref:Uncharacterized protein n=1 Tax=Tanacetum coccineum TaxID=301880 RepID=A0ABQ5GXP0_9ASTR